MSFPKENRLARLDFIRTRSGRNFSNQFFSGVICTPKDSSASRFAVVVSLRISRKAIIRNKLRRLIYQCLGYQKFPQPLDLIVIPKKSMLNLTRDQICTLLDSNLSKILTQV